MPNSDLSVLLDLDGTLIDSQPGIVSSCRAALRALGHEPPEVMDIQSIIGPPIEDGMRYLLEPYGDSRISDAVDAYRSDYSAQGLLMSTLYDGIPAALSSLRDTGVRLFLATSKRVFYARRILQNLEQSDIFTGIYGSEPGVVTDHKPELIAHILKQNQLNPDKCIMVGDRKYDISGAHANNMKAIGVAWGYGSREELELAGADALINSPSELKNTILDLLRGADN
ncbi:HAD-IA family hydrolase [Phyllobacterium myrsinacearum]|uniref:Phosphoglycolate phosphatase n=1 Tax=Phyllobacterium myrsinacearum TaxID=28101 RepID=A0A839EPB8_9HYPH|nr:HAD-IA family hydrolase [Phyllobacterium myrsinacearum]MBA8878317.1 phosphoglycolate phosphatase [Phyllobacterium myrsinacearum]